MLDGLWSSFLGGLLGSAVCAVILGLLYVAGSVQALRALQARQDDLDDRIMREQKARASARGVEARQAKQSTEEEVEALLKQSGAVPGQPRLLGARRGTHP